jgi:hypothetical protein
MWNQAQRSNSLKNDSCPHFNMGTHYLGIVMAGFCLLQSASAQRTPSITCEIALRHRLPSADSALQRHHNSAAIQHGQGCSSSSHLLVAARAATRTARRPGIRVPVRGRAGTVTRGARLESAGMPAVGEAAVNAEKIQLIQEHEPQN